MSDILARIDRLKRELDALRPLPAETAARVAQKLRIESSFHSNAVEGNSLTLGETRSLILHGLTASGKPLRDHLDIEGHNEAVKAIEDAVGEERGLTEAFIRQLHAILLKEPYELDATTPDGRPTKRRIAIGAYKAMPNNVRTSTGETYYFTPPEQVKSAMSDLIDWYRAQETEGKHPIVTGAAFHYKFVRIHPFDDGNGRMARLLMNMILIHHGFTIAIIPQEERTRYIHELEQADKSEDLTIFTDYIASCCEHALTLHLKAARGESIEEIDDIDREIALFNKSFLSRKAEEDYIFSRDYVKNVVNPFWLYCCKKLDSISYNFEPSMYIEGEKINGNIFPRFQRNKFVSIFYAFFVPKKMLKIHTSISFSFHVFPRFIFIIDNEFDSHSCNWEFYLSKHPPESYDGQDLDELKMRFNHMLRRMMDYPQEKTSGAGRS